MAQPRVGHKEKTAPFWVVTSCDALLNEVGL